MQWNNEEDRKVGMEGQEATFSPRPSVVPTAHSSLLKTQRLTTVWVTGIPAAETARFPACFRIPLPRFLTQGTQVH